MAVEQRKPAGWSPAGFYDEEDIFEDNNAWKFTPPADALALLLYKDAWARWLYDFASAARVAAYSAGRWEWRDGKWAFPYDRPARDAAGNPLAFDGQTILTHCRSDARPGSNSNPPVAGQLAQLTEELDEKSGKVVWRKTGETFAAVLDFDNKEEEWPRHRIIEVVYAVAQSLVSRGLNPMLFISGGGKGFHIWLLWRSPQPIHSVHAALTEVLAEHDLEPGTDSVPNGQAAIYPTPGGDAFGGIVALPFARHSIALHPDYYLPCVPYVWFSHDVPDAPAPAQRVKRAERPKNLALLRELLSFIPADCPQNEWVKISMAAKAWCGEDAREPLREWSASSKADFANITKKYRDYDHFFDGLKPRGEVDAGTLFHHAIENGFTPSRLLPGIEPEWTEPQLDPAAAKIRLRNAVAEFFA